MFCFDIAKWPARRAAWLLALIAAPVSSAVTFNYTGSMETWTVPNGVTSITVDVRGSQGGDCIYNDTAKPDDLGGKGGRVVTVYPVMPGQTLNLFVGGIPYNGGGNGAGFICQANGGGASDVRIGGTALTDRVVVAGGGGGGGNNCSTNAEPGGDGGGLIGGKGWQCGGQQGTAVGMGGTQTAGGASGTNPATAGALGIGGNGGGAGTASGGGGGGYYGGGGAAYGGGGGGSSYTSSWATSVAHTQGFQNGTGQIIIVPAPTITAWPSGSTITYGQTLADSALTGGAASVPGTFAWTTPTTAPSAGPASYSVTFTPNDTVNYSTVTDTASVAVNKATLTITADDKTGIYGQALPALTVSYGGWVNVDTDTSLSATATASTTATATSPVGSYPITASGAVVNSNYIINYLAGTLIIGQAGQTLAISSAAPASAKVGGSYAVTTTPGGSTKPVALAVTGNCSLSGSTVSFDSYGSCTVTASQKGDANYSDATDVSQTFSIAQSDSGVNISSTPNPSQPGQDVMFSVAVSLDSTKSLKAQSSLTKAVTVPTGTVTLTDGTTTLGTAPLDASGNVTLTVKTLITIGTHSIVASYSGDANYTAVQSAAFTQTVSAAPVASPVPLFGELWEKLLLSLMVVGVSALCLRMRRAA